jgi:Fe2+ or Zn2+ uptake regulation protein
VAATEIHETAEQRLARVGQQRYTASRRAIVEVLRSSGRPLTLPQILDADESLAQSSAYRNLTELIDANVVHRIMGADERAHFELAEDITGHHHHLICVACGSVSDFRIPDAVEAELDRALDHVADGEGFTVVGHRLDLLGHCVDCALT